MAQKTKAAPAEIKAPKAKTPTPAKGKGKPEAKAAAKPVKENPAGYARELLLAGKDNKEVREALEKKFPSYGAAAIAPGVYRRELIAKGLLKA